MKTSILLADDENVALQLHQSYLARFENIAVVGAFTDGKSALEAIRQHRPDLLLLDIQMPEMTGIELASSLQGDYAPVIIFITAFDHFALRAFEVNAIDYLLKPFDFERFEKAVLKAIKQVEAGKLQETQQRYIDLLKQLAPPTYAEVIAVKDGGRIQLLQVSAISHIEADGNYICIYTDRSKHLHHETLTSMEARLNPRQFARIHRSTLVQIAQVSEIRSHFNGDYTVVLKNGKNLRMSRSYKANLIP